MGTVEAPAQIVVRPEPPGAEVEGSVEASAGAPAADGAERVEWVTVRELLERMLAEPGKPISIIKKVRYFEVTTLGDLIESEEDPDAFLNVITKPYRIRSGNAGGSAAEAEERASRFHLLRSHRAPHRSARDLGIVQSGLIDNFARGMAVRRGEQIETYTVHIPREADEVRLDRSSSFLGRLIHHKTQESFVYNFREHRMGRNPDRIYPGQEIVIVNFKPVELIGIYKHFTGSQG